MLGSVAVSSALPGPLSGGLMSSGLLSAVLGAGFLYWWGKFRILVTSRVISYSRHTYSMLYFSLFNTVANLISLYLFIPYISIVLSTVKKLYDLSCLLINQSINQSNFVTSYKTNQNNPQS